MHPGHALSQALLLLATRLSPERPGESPPPPSFSSGVCDNPDIAGLPFCDATLSIDARVDDLVARIPLDEAFGLLVNNASRVDSVHLPAYGWWSEGLHGVALSPAVTFGGSTPVATSFPQVVSVAAAFNRTLFYKIGEAISTEARAFYNANHAGLTFWTPNVNIYRDPRWGRGQETPGEDPFLSAEYAVAFVRGLQGEEAEHNASLTEPSTSKSDSKFLKVSASCKHFSSYSQEVPRHRNDAIVSKRDQADTYFPAFEACVRRGHVSSVMCSYNAVNGIPACADKALLTDLVRKQWGFDGYIVSDCGAVADVIYEHHYTQSPEQTCASTLNAGMDINCGIFLSEHGKKALASGRLHKAAVHKALSHLFRVQMRLGMFEKGGQPFADITPEMVDTPAHRQLALEAAQQSVVLLKNENGTLPLSASLLSSSPSAAPSSSTDPPASLALIGPHFNASEVLLGNYQGIPSHIVTPLEGISSYAKHVTFARGCEVSGETAPDFDEATRAAEQAAQVILFVGLDQSQEREEIDRSHLELPGFQNDLIKVVLEKAKKPVVLVVISGGSVDLAAYRNHPKVGAIVFAGYLGQAGGQAIADVLFGAYNPVGRLTQTFYTKEFANQVSIYDMNMRPTRETGNPGRTYRFLSKFELAVYGFGEGLSYTDFRIEWQNAAPRTFVRADVVRKALASSGNVAGQVSSQGEHTMPLNVTVVNIGKRDGEYSMTVFVFAPGGGSDGNPICYLGAFGRTPMLKPQEKFHFHFEIPVKTFALANDGGAWEVREGVWFLQSSVNGGDGSVRHEVHVGSGEEDAIKSNSSSNSAPNAKIAKTDNNKAVTKTSEEEEETESVVDQLKEMRMQGVENAAAIDRA